MNRRYDHEPATGFRYWSRLAALAVFYAFVVAGSILTALLILHPKP